LGGIFCPFPLEDDESILTNMLVCKGVDQPPLVAEKGGIAF